MCSRYDWAKKPAYCASLNYEIKTPERQLIGESIRFIIGRRGRLAGSNPALSGVLIFRA